MSSSLGDPLQNKDLSQSKFLFNKKIIPAVRAQLCTLCTHSTPPSHKRIGRDHMHIDERCEVSALLLGTEQAPTWHNCPLLPHNQKKEPTNTETDVLKTSTVLSGWTKRA